MAVFVFLLIGGILLAAIYFFKQQTLRQAAIQRLFQEGQKGTEETFQRAREFNYLRRYHWVHIILAIISICFFLWFLKLKLIYALAFSFIVYLLAGQLEDIRIIHHSNKLEEQLADL